MMRAALYARVSTEEQAKEGFSIDAQLNILSAWAVVKGYQVADRYIDDGYSAKNLNRPAVQRLLEDCRAGAIDAVVVWRLDRLSRSLRDTLTVVEDVFRAKNVEFISTTESIDTTTTSGRLMLNILASFAQNEREVNEERVRTVSMDLARQCVHMGGTPPYGFSVGADRHCRNNLQLCLGITRYDACGNRSLDALLLSGIGHNHALNILDDIAGNLDGHFFRQLLENFAQRCGAVSQGDGLCAAGGQQQFAFQHFNIGIDDLGFQHRLSPPEHSFVFYV